MTIKSNLEDSFEKLVEQGATQSKKVVKSAGQQIKQTFSPTKMWEELLGVSSQTDSVADGGKRTESVVKNGGKHIKPARSKNKNNSSNTYSDL